MKIKHVAVPAAIAIFAGTMISDTAPAQADKISYQHSCGFALMAPDEETDGPITIYATFLTSESVLDRAARHHHREPRHS